jgi:hypothetical protein
VIYLCRLCSEQREFLKKSGAWFLKKYPSYLNDNNNKMSNSTSNLNEIEKIPLSATNSFASGSQSTTSSPSYMTKNNKSYTKTEAISPTESLSFRFWKVKGNQKKIRKILIFNSLKYSNLIQMEEEVIIII